MPLIPYADIAALPEDVRERFEKLPRKLNIFRMWANAPPVSCRACASAAQSSRARNSIAACASWSSSGSRGSKAAPMNGCSMCRSPRPPAAARTRSQALEDALIDDAAFDAKEKALLRFSAKSSENVKASEEAVKAMQAHFSPQEIVEVILTCGFYMTMARLTETTRVDIDAGRRRRVRRSPHQINALIERVEADQVNMPRSGDRNTNRFDSVKLNTGRTRAGREREIGLSAAAARKRRRLT
jgi:hypothetical protein